MKAWIRRWLGIERPSKKETIRDFEDLAAAAIEALGNAQKEHIADLRVLIDKANDREVQLSKMVQLAIEHQFYRPVITGKSPENRVLPAIPPEQLTDVAAFDEEEDAQLIREQEARREELESLIDEQNKGGIHKVE